MSICWLPSEENTFTAACSCLSFISFSSAVAFPIPKILDVVSEPVKACKNKMLLQISLPSKAWILRISYTGLVDNPLLMSLRKYSLKPLFLAWCNKRINKSVSSPTVTVVIIWDDDTAEWTISKSASPSACRTVHPIFVKASDMSVIKCYLFVSFAKKFSFCPTNFIPEMKFVAIEDNNSSAIIMKCEVCVGICYVQVLSLIHI